MVVTIIWHYVLTLDKEITYFWRRKPTGACALFLANQYFTLIFAIYNTSWWTHSTAYTASAWAYIFAYLY